MHAEHVAAGRSAVGRYSVGAADHRHLCCTVVLDQDFVGWYPYLAGMEERYRGAAAPPLFRSGLAIRPDHEVDNLAMAMSLVASTRGVALLPAYARNFLPGSVTSRPIRGDAPTIDLVVGYNKANTSPILKLFLSRMDELVARVSEEDQGGVGLGKRRGMRHRPALEPASSGI